MSNATFIIGKKNYSSWSLRGWLAVKTSGLEFDEKLMPLFEDNHPTPWPVKHRPVKPDSISHDIERASARLPLMDRGTNTGE
tara:strand:- start:555 stop:800 length:246 start_codon:yes stop_codon:yes gene_type:complete